MTKTFKGLLGIMIGSFLVLGFLASSVWGTPAPAKPVSDSQTGMEISTPGIQEMELEENSVPQEIQVAQASDSSAPGVSSLTNVDALPGVEGVSVTLESSGSLQYTAFKLQKPLRLVMDFPKTRQGVLNSKMTVGEGILESIKPMYFEEAQVLRLEFALKEASAYEIQRPRDNTLIVTFKKADNKNMAQESSGSSSQSERKPVGGVSQSSRMGSQEEVKSARFSEERCLKILGGEKPPISLDFQNAQLVNIFRILSEVGGFNIILAPSVGGSTNIRLVDVPWNQAMELILKNNGLGKQCFDNIVRVATQENMAAEDKARKNAKTAKKEADLEERLAGELFTEVVQISYASITELQSSMDTMRTERGRVTIDSRTNTMILTDIPASLQDMIQVIENLDKPTSQVMIQARIVEVNRNAAKNLGIQWGGNFQGNTSKEFPATVEGGSSTNTTDDFIIDLPNAANLIPGNVAGIGLTLGSLAEDVLVDIQISALEEQGKLRTVSNPRVTTLDNKEARIQSGRRIPYQTVSQDGTRVEFVDANIELRVTPHITVNQTVLMTIAATKNAADFTNTAANGVPTITTKEAFTEVLVNDAETTVLGGLYENSMARNTSQVPFFGDIPWLGSLFKNFSDADTVDELLIFITPTIVKN